MYVKIRKDGAIGIGRGTEGKAEIALGYGEAHMIAAALGKLAQTARSYKQTYVKTTDVGAGNKISFERSETGLISISGDKQTYYCTENEIRELSEKLKNLPPVEVAPPSRFVAKIDRKDANCLSIKNSGNMIDVTLPEAAVIRTSIKSSLDSRFYHEQIKIGDKAYSVQRSSDLKWEVTGDNTVRFTAYEIESLLAGLQNGIMDVLMDLVKSMGSDELTDIRVKSHVQRIEEEATKILSEYDKAKRLVKDLVKRSSSILAKLVDAESRTEQFIMMCELLYGKIEPEYVGPLFGLLSNVFIPSK